MFLIFFLAFYLLWAVFYRYGLGLRCALLAAMVAQGLLIVLITEALSFARALSCGPLAGCWAGVCVLGCILLLPRKERVGRVSSRIPLDLEEQSFFWVSGLIVLVTGAIALVAVPSNYDSMVYHLPRVAHWAFDRTVTNYPTHTILQLVLPPFSEYAILQSYVLGGGEQMANLIQWASMIASLAGVSLLTELLGGSRRVQLMAVLLAATLPPGILQSTGTQNDYVATLWAVVVAVGALQWQRSGSRLWAFLSVSAVALAFLTKGTAVIVSLPFWIWALVRVDWRPGRKFVWALVAAGMVLAVNGSFWLRLAQLDPRPWEAMQLGGSALAGRLDIRGMVSSAVRTLAGQMVLPEPHWQQGWQSVVERLHSWMGQGVDDPDFTVAGSRFSAAFCPYPSEEYTAFGVHAWIYFVAFWACLWAFCRSGRPADAKPWRVYGALLTAAVIVFCSVVKWQEGQVRFLLPFYVLFAPLAAWAVARLAGRYRLALVVICLAAAFPSLVNNQQRSLVPYGAVERRHLVQRFHDGGLVFDRLEKDGFFRTPVEGGRGFFRDGVADRLEAEVQLLWPNEAEGLLGVLEKAPSFATGFWRIPEGEMVFSRFGKLSRDRLTGQLEFLSRQIDARKECRDIGYIKGFLQYEYPLWRLAVSRGRQLRVVHLQVMNVSGQLADPAGEPEPCVIVQEGFDGAAVMNYRGRAYRKGSDGPWQIYLQVL